MSELHKKYQKDMVPKLKESFGYSNALACPRMEKVVINVGLGRAMQDKAVIAAAKETLRRISGQEPVVTKARKSIAGFKVRQGAIIGMKVTLRGERMYDFIEKLVHVSFARIQDFRGISRSTVDKAGNLSVGFKENIAFPEIQSDDIEHVHGLQVCVKSTAKNAAEGLALFELIGFPFKQE